uniref:Venom protein family 6 protein 2 n=1 Tax=Platymeris rhadamanthus TaxID=1134088 RepID=A0A6B9KZ42_PLARH|nr:venom protein family 6 protein 2 [Platymeris rhadamanthus]
MKSIILLAIVCVAVQANISNSDVNEMVKNLNDSIKQLEIMKQHLEGSMQVTINYLKDHAQEDNGEDGLKCFRELAKPFQDTVNLRIDESLGGYIRSSRSLINDLKSGMFDEGELEHTKHMLSEEGSYFKQMQNSVEYMLKEISQDTLTFDKTVHDKCCKHD